MTKWKKYVYIKHILYSPQSKNMEKYGQIQVTWKDTSLIKRIMATIISIGLILNTWCTNDNEEERNWSEIQKTTYILNTDQYNIEKSEFEDIIEIDGEKYKIKISFWKNIEKLNTEFIDDDTQWDQIISWDEYICSDSNIWPYQIIKENRTWDKYILTDNTYAYEIYHDNNTTPIGTNRNSSLNKIKQWIINTFHNSGIELSNIENEKINEIMNKAKDLPKKLNHNNN